MLSTCHMSLLSSTKSNRARQGSPLLQGDEPFTLLHNLRTRPLAFVTACLGLMGVLAVKVLLTRAEASAKPGDR